MACAQIVQSVVEVHAGRITSEYQAANVGETRLALGHLHLRIVLEYQVVNVGETRLALGHLHLRIVLEYQARNEGETCMSHLHHGKRRIRETFSMGSLGRITK